MSTKENLFSFAASAALTVFAFLCLAAYGPERPETRLDVQCQIIHAEAMHAERKAAMRR